MTPLILAASLDRRDLVDLLKQYVGSGVQEELPPGLAVDRSPVLAELPEDNSRPEALGDLIKLGESGAWEEEPELLIPEGDRDLVELAVVHQDEISRHIPNALDEAQLDASIDLPEFRSIRHLQRFAEDAEWVEAARKLLLHGLVSTDKKN